MLRIHTVAFRRASMLCSAAALALCAPHASAAAPGFTLDSVLAAPFASNLATSPHRDALVWTVHERGAHNVVIWKDGIVRALTHSVADDGQAISDAHFVPDATAVVYERGGDGDSDNDTGNPNPTSPAKHEPRKILLTSVVGEKTLELGNGREPVVSPKGDRVAWIGTDGSSDGQVMSASIATLDGGKIWTATKAAPLFTVRGSATAPVWSPDGSRIAITNKRGDHSYVALYTLGATNVVFAQPAFSNDGNPVWSPDGSHVAFVRLPGGVSTLSPEYDDPNLFPAWSIVVADAATGSGATVWRALPGRGHEFTIADGTQPLFWSQSGRLAFIWERDGWRHLYSIAATGGTAALLTPGAFEIEQVALGSGGNDLIYTSNESDIEARHVWRVPFAGGERTRITGGTTNQWSPVGFANGTYAYVDASYDTPGTVTVSDGSATRRLEPHPLPPDYPVTQLVRPQSIVFKAADGLAIHGQIFLAHDGRAKHPALIFVHGGPERQMLTTYHYYEAYTNLYELNQYLVGRGFDVLSVNYRSGIMYGHDFFEPQGRGWLGASEYQDVVAGARVLGARPDVDAKRLGVYGLSYGGYLTALALARNSDIFAAGVDQAGVHDWPALFDTYHGARVGTEQQRAVAFAASPLGSIATWKSPVLLDQGDDDPEVPFAQTVTLSNLLEARGVDVTLHAVPDERHEYDVYTHELDRFTRTADYLIKRLGAKMKTPSKKIARK